MAGKDAIAPGGIGATLGGMSPRALFAMLLAVLAPGIAGAAGAAAAELGSAPRPGRDFSVGEPAMAMLWVAPGTLRLSSPHGAGDDTTVTLTQGYWLGRTEVTQRQWRAMMDYIPLPSRFKGSERPAEQVSWNLAMIFCGRLTERERVAGRLPEGYEYTLPTEAQWEYACRAGTTGIHAGDLAAMAWYEINSGGETHPVAQKLANAWGFFDMHGNVTEWCADWYAPYPGGSVDDHAGAASGQFRVMRGGAWATSAGECRATYRHWSPTNGPSHAIGFRVALAPRLAARPEARMARNEATATGRAGD